MYFQTPYSSHCYPVSLYTALFPLSSLDKPNMVGWLNLSSSFSERLSLNMVVSLPSGERSCSPPSSFRESWPTGGSLRLGTQMFRRQRRHHRACGHANRRESSGFHSWLFHRCQLSITQLSSISTPMMKNWWEDTEDKRGEKARSE